MPFDLRIPESRYERKFIIDSFTDLKMVENAIKLHPAMFSEIYEERQVNNIYLDTRQLDFFHDNVVGRSDRKKVRIRWYGELVGTVEKPVLEYKIKRGELGWKYAFPLPSMNVGNDLSEEGIRRCLMNSGGDESIKEEVKLLHPVLLNSYHRKYFQSADGEFRITLDWDFSYVRFSNLGNTMLDRRTVSSECILELKYAYTTSRRPSQISSGIPFRVSKNSKYVNGVSFFEPGLPL